MAEQDVGGIGVKFTADAAQLKEQLTSLEQRLRSFNEAHGQTKVKLQASLVMPGNRVLADFRRDIEGAFKAQGSAGQIKARIELLPPTAAQIKTLSAGIEIKVPVIGDFKWGKAPPKTVEVTVVTKDESGRKAAATPQAIAQKAATGQAAAGRAAAPARPRASRARRETASEQAAVFSEANGWTSPMLFDSLLEPGGGRKKQMRDQLVARGYKPEDIDAWVVARRSAGRSRPGGGSRGFVDPALRRGVTVPRIADTGVVPLSSGAIRSMQKSGQLPLPYKTAGLYDPTVPRAKFGVGNLPSDAEIEARVRRAVAITPPERMASGNKWWPTAGKLIAGAGQGTGFNAHQLAGVAALGTTGLDWPGSIRILDKVMNRWKDGVRDLSGLFGGVQMYDRERQDAYKILTGSGRPEDVERLVAGSGPTGRPKISQMYRGFLGDPNALPLDRHFQALTTGGEIPTSQIKRVTEVVRQTLKSMGLQPAGAMAGMWETAGGGEPFGPDPWGQLRARGRTRAPIGQNPAMAMAANLPGGARGFAAPAWLKTKPVGRADPGLMGALMDELQPTGRPGIHIEPPAFPMAARGYGSMFSVARNEEGKALGALMMQLRGPHNVGDVMPYVDPAARRQGIGSALYAHAQRAGFDVETASDMNAGTELGRGRAQTNAGAALWLARKRQIGVDPREARNTARARYYRSNEEPEPDENPVVNPGLPERGPGEPLVLNTRGPWVSTPLVGGSRGFARDEDFYERQRSERRRNFRENQAKGRIGLPSLFDDSGVTDYGRRQADVAAIDAALGRTGPETAAEEPAAPATNEWTIDAHNGIKWRFNPETGETETRPLTGPGSRGGRIRRPKPPVAAGGGARTPGGGPPPTAAGGGAAPWVDAGGWVGGPGWSQDFGRTLMAAGGRPPESPFAYPPTFQSRTRAAFTTPAPASGTRDIYGELSQRAAVGAAPGTFAGPLHARTATRAAVEGLGNLPPGVGPAITAGTPSALRVRDIARPELEAGAGLEAPTFLRPGSVGGGPTSQFPATGMAADLVGDILNNPELSPQARAQLEEAVAAGSEAGTQKGVAAAASGGGGGQRPPPTSTGGPAGGGPMGPNEDFVGRPSPSAFVQQMLGVTSQGRIAIQEARQAGQIRAVGTTVASQLGGLLGRGVDVDKINRMTATLTRLEHVVRNNAGAFEELEAARAEFGEGSEKFRDLDQKLKPAREQMKGLVSEFNELQPNKFAQMATGLASSIGGTIIGLGLFQGVTSAISIAGDALGEVVERQTGYNNIASKTTDALADQTRALHGWAEGAVAAQTSITGMSDANAAFVHSLVDARVAGQAANKNLVEQNDLFQTALSIRRQTGQLPSGVDASALQTTGGLNILGLQTGLFGTPSAQEILGRQLGGERFGGITTFNPNSTAQQAISGNLFGAVGASTRSLASGSAASPIGGVGAIPIIGAGLAQLFGNPDQIPDAARGQGNGTLRGLDPKIVQDFVDSVSMVNSAMDKAADTGLRFAANTEDLNDTQVKVAQEEAARQADLARQAGAPDLAKAIQQGGGRLLLQGLAGSNATQIAQIQRAAAQYQQGALIPNKGEIAATQARSLRAQLGLNQQQGQLQRESVIPGQSYLRQLFAGRAPTGGQVNIPNPLTAGTASLPPGVLNQPGIDTSQLTEGLGQVQMQANKGRDALTDMISKADEINKRAGISSNLLGSFEALTKAAGQTAAQIRAISQASAWMQVNLQVKQINEQIYVMSRSLEDAKSFLSGVGKGELGILQFRARGLEIAQAELGFRQQELGLLNQQLGIQANQLQLTQRQRQINFQRAVAGFVTPGQTPEEIAARQKEAELEANFAQSQQDLAVKQLDNQREGVSLAAQQLSISKEQFAVQQAMVDVSAERAIGDLTRAIGLLQEQARVTVQLQVNSDAIEAYQAVLEEQKAQIEEVITEAYNTVSTVLSNAASLAAQYAGTLTEWNNMLIDHLNDYMVRARQAMGGPGAPNTTRAGNTGPTAPPGGPQATGFYGSVTSATQMTVGEAGPETVAVIRNPRSITMQPDGGGGGWGGGGQINVYVTGNNIKDEQTAEAFANEIARKVEENMSRRTSLLGLRPN